MPTQVLSRRLVCALLCAIAVLAGCSSSKTAVRPGLPEAFPNHTAPEIHQNIVRSSDTLRAYSATARVTVESPQRSGSFNATIRQQRADSLYMSLSLFGIEGARVLVTPDSFFFYDRRQKRLMTGSVDAAEQMMPAPVQSDQVFANMLGMAAPEPTTSWTVKSDSSLYFLSDPSGLRTYTIDPTRWRVVRYAKKDGNGDLVEERLFSNFTTIRGVMVAKRVLFRRPNDDVMALLNYRDLTLNPDGLSFDLGVGPDVQRIPFPGAMP